MTVLGAALAATLVFAAAPVAAAQDQDNTTLSQWLKSCQGNRQACLTDLSYGYEAAYMDMDEICPPSGLSEATATEKEMEWLENSAAYNSGMAAGKKLDAEWTALHVLWPCSR